jgi:hypothetical protein
MIHQVSKQKRPWEFDAMRRALIFALGTALSTASLALAAHGAPAQSPEAKAAAGDPTIPQPGWVPPKNAMG